MEQGVARGLRLAARVALCTSVALAAGGCTAGESAGEAPSSASANAVAVPNASLYGIHFFPGVRRDGAGNFAVDPRPDWTGGDDGPRMWNVEMVSGDGYQWFTVDGYCYGNTTCASYRAFAARNVDIITRFDDYAGGRTVPTTDAGVADWKRRLARVFDDSRGASIARTSRVFVVGNEPNLCGEAGGGAGCEPASSWIPADRYAAAYRGVRDEIHRLASGVGEVAVLLAGPSGGGHDGLGYLGAQLGNLCSDALDGVALHAYGGADDDPDRDGTYGFSRDLRAQIQLVDAACGGRFRSVPLFVTEFSRGARPVADSDFVYKVYDWLRRWNAAGHHNVVAATYFLGRGDGFALENIALDAPNDHQRSRAAFARAAQQRWRAGSFGSASVPGGGAESERVSCGEWAARNGFVSPACEWRGNGACSAQGARTSDCEHCCDQGAPPPATCRCVRRGDLDNVCNYQGAERDGCAEFSGGRACDPGRAGGIDWVAGWQRYRELCGAAPPPPPPPPPPPCACRSGVNNYCQYGPNAAGCGMTAPGGYCDPNGDGSFGDADWGRGFSEFGANCQ